jgi:hypothetical protein
MSSVAETTGSVTGTLLERAEVSTAVRERMFDLLDRHFEGITRPQFESDLAEKNWVLLLQTECGSLVGFSTLLVYETTVDCSPISVVCSGDTIVDPQAWSSAALPREWIAAVNQLRSLFPNGPYYWLLLTSGFRSYRYRLLSTFWRSFWPRFDQPTPAATQRVLDSLASQRFGHRYDPQRGIVQFERPQVLRPHLAGVPPQRLTDPHVAFFVKRNLHHARGDELVCLCELGESNLTRAGERMVFGARRTGATR